MKITRDTIREMYQLNQQIKELSTVLDSMKKDLIETAELEGKTSYQWSEIGVKLVHSKRTTVSATELKKIDPDLFEALAKTSEFVSVRFN